MTKASSRQYYHLLHELQSVDFVLLELNLYLDTHPKDQQAISQFQQYHKRRVILLQQFETEFGPLKGYGNSQEPGGSFAWSQAPWPWQV